MIIVDQKELRLRFIHYLKSHYNYARPDIMASNVFYSWNNYIGMNFWDIFKDNDSMIRAKELITKKFEEVGRKNPKGHASVQCGCWKKFHEFLLTEPQAPRN